MKRLIGVAVCLFVLTLGALGCGSPIVNAAKVADGASVIQVQAAPILKEKCIEPIATVSDAELAKLREVCDPAIASYESLRVAHIALRSALIAYDANRDGDASRIVQTVLSLASDVGVAVVALARVIETITRKP